MIIMVFLDVRWHFSGKCAEPLFVYFSNTFKYVSAHETITLINASIILKKEEASIQHFQTKLGITKYSIVTNSNDSVTAPHD